MTTTRQAQVHVGQRGHAPRFAPHLHVNDADIARLLQVLEELVH